MEHSYQLNCPVCSEILLPSDVLSSTTCGHIFHKTPCLTRWLSGWEFDHRKISQLGIFAFVYFLRSNSSRSPFKKNFFDVIFFRILQSLLASPPASNRTFIAATQHVHSAEANARWQIHIAFTCPKWIFKIASNCSTEWMTSIDRSRSMRTNWSASKRRRRHSRRICERRRKTFTRCWGERRRYNIRKVSTIGTNSIELSHSHTHTHFAGNIPRSERNKNLLINVTAGAQRVVKEQMSRTTSSSSSSKKKRNTSRLQRSKTYFGRKRAEHRNNNNSIAEAAPEHLELLSDSD